MTEQELKDLQAFAESGEEIKTDDVKEALSKLTEEYEALARGSKVDYSNMESFKAATDFIDSLFSVNPPVKFIEDLLSHYKKRKLKITNYDVPDVMRELGLRESVTDDGTKIKMKCCLSVKQENKALLFAWLKNNGNADDVKTNLIFPKGEYSEEIDNYLQEQGYSYESKEDCHNKTVERIIKNRVEQAEKNLEKIHKGKELSKEEIQFSLLPPKNILKISRFEMAEITTKEE